MGMWCCGEAGHCELLVVAGMSPPALPGWSSMGHRNGAAPVPVPVPGAPACPGALWAALGPSCALLAPAQGGCSDSGARGDAVSHLELLLCSVCQH